MLETPLYWGIMESFSVVLLCSGLQIALMLEKNPNMTRAEVEEALKNKSDKIGKIDYVNGFNNYYGYGKIDASMLLK